MATTFQLRTYRRLPLQGQGIVHFAGKKVDGKGRLWNVSLSGCRMDSGQAAGPGMVFSMLLQLSDRDAVLIEGARVVWTRGAEFGIHITTIRPGELAHLERFLIAHQG